MALDPSQNLIAIQTALEADINLMQWGDSGIGKSAMARQAVKILEAQTEAKESYLYHDNPTLQALVDKGSFECRFEDVRMAHCDVSDWGLPRVFAEILDKEGKIRLVPITEVGDQPILDYVHKTTRPDWWPRADFPGLFVLFLDEVNRGEKYAQNGAMEITAERSLRGRQAPGTMRLLSANNPTTGDFITEELDTAMKARWCHVHVETDAKVFIANRSDYLDPISQNIIYSGQTGNNHNVLVKPGDGAIQDDWALADQVEWRPRTWEQHAKLVRFIEWKQKNHENWVSDNKMVLQTLISGLIGVKNMASWWSTFESGEFVSLERLLNGEMTYQRTARLGHDRVAMMGLLLRNGMNDKAFVDPQTGTASNSRARNFLRFFKDLQQDRREIASMLAQHFMTNQGNPDHAICNRILYRDTEFIEFTRELQNLGGRNTL